MDAGDSAFFAWAIGWERHALLHRSLRACPTATCSIPCATRSGWTSRCWARPCSCCPLALFTDDAVLLYNVARLLTFVLSALTAYLLARELGAAEGPSLLAGAAFAFSPVRVDQIAHLSTLGTQWLPLVVLFAVRFFRDRTRAATRWPAGGAVRPRGLRLRIPRRDRPARPAPRASCRCSGAAGPACPWPRPGAGLAAAAAPSSLSLAPRGPGAARVTCAGRRRRCVFSAALESFLATSSWNHVWGEVTAPFRTDLLQQPVPRPRAARCSPLAGRRRRSGARAGGRAARRWRSS